MRRQIIYLSAVPLGLLFITTDVPAQTSAPMKATASDKMLSSDQATKMRACEKRAMREKIKMEDRTSFVANCMVGKAESN